VLIIKTKNYFDSGFRVSFEVSEVVTTKAMKKFDVIARLQNTFPFKKEGPAG